MVLYSDTGRNRQGIKDDVSLIVHLLSAGHRGRDGVHSLTVSD